MANINDEFPSKYLKASDLKGRNVLIKMSHTAREQVGDDSKLILYFQGSEKGMVLNKTNANNIAMLYGDETDDWATKEIVLFEAMVDFQGKTVAAIRCRAPQPKDRAGRNQPAPQRRPEPVGDDINDDIPF